MAAISWREVAVAMQLENWSRTMFEDPCYVYIIGTTTGAYKIGVANDPWKRQKALQTGCSDPSEIILLIICRNKKHAFAVENELHKELMEYRSSGEWFKLPKSILGELLLDLGSKLKSLRQDIPVVAYPGLADNPAMRHLDKQLERARKRFAQSEKTAELDTILLKIIKEVSVENQNKAPIPVIISRSNAVGIDEKIASETLDRLLLYGEIFKIQPNFIKIA